ncbi:hypothetical protein SAMN05443244_2995 [Terriglobus roseus]|uniref:Uncharacterized protein n=1 Tax=Terriglobus roseus TaxID=392734 RepID=A0A1H4QXY3_9BACT|nr:hypothetical protein SAMN05443244_2995 [Terriglobus roseus]
MHSDRRAVHAARTKTYDLNGVSKLNERLERLQDPVKDRATSHVQRAIVAFLLVLGGLAFALHFLHLRADFPNHSPWVDWAKYTDEGWYGDAAIRHYLRGTWRLPGDFNPAVALPVWPLVEAGLFRFTGVGIVAARALTVCVFGCILCSSFFFLRLRAERRGDRPMRTVFAAAAVLVLAASPFVYVFTRLAILEPLLVLMMLLSLQAAYAMRLARLRWQRAAYAAGVGLLIALMIGTKTTAVFLLPAIAYMLADSAECRGRRMLRTGLITGGVVALLCGSYFLMLVHRGYLGDFRYLFSANAYTGITRSTFFKTVGETLTDGMWTGPLTYPLAGLMLVIACLRPRVWRDPVFTSLALWAAGYMIFMAYHANMQPRYYLVVAVPLVLLLLRGALHVAEWNPVAPLALVPLLLLVVGHEARQTVNFARHPDYTYQTAAVRIEHIIEAEPSHSHTVLSISGSNLSLMTGLPSICDDFGTMQLEDRIAAYQPGWFVAWNYVEDDKMQALSRFYTLTRVGEFPAMDDPDRNLMIVYRLDPKEGVKPRRKRPGAKLLPM